MRTCSCWIWKWPERFLKLVQWARHIEIWIASKGHQTISCVYSSKTVVIGGKMGSMVGRAEFVSQSRLRNKHIQRRIELMFTESPFFSCNRRSERKYHFTRFSFPPVPSHIRKGVAYESSPSAGICVGNLKSNKSQLLGRRRLNITNARLFKLFPSFTEDATLNWKTKVVIALGILWEGGRKSCWRAAVEWSPPLPPTGPLPSPSPKGNYIGMRIPDWGWTFCINIIMTCRQIYYLLGKRTFWGGSVARRSSYKGQSRLLSAWDSQFCLFLLFPHLGFTFTQ